MTNNASNTGPASEAMLVIEDGYHRVTITENATGMWKFTVQWYSLKQDGSILRRVDGLACYAKDNVYALVAELCKKYKMAYKRKLNKWYDSEE